MYVLLEMNNHQRCTVHFTVPCMCLSQRAASSIIHPSFIHPFIIHAFIYPA